mgnify:CR=1 FL=1
MSCRLEGEFCLHYSPSINTYLPMDFKKYLENRLMMKELQLMKAEDKEAPSPIIERLFAVVKELRYIYKTLFWNENNQ